MQLLDAHHEGLARHSDVVADWAVAIARALDLDPDHVDQIETAARMHDIGKVAVPSEILAKPGPLTDSEWEIVKTHPQAGAEMLEDPMFATIRPWVLAHHERPDGRGYPLGLTAEQIPIEASIIAVADAWEAMTSDRCYREAMSVQVARQELIDGAGSQWDARVVEGLLSVLARLAPAVAA